MESKSEPEAYNPSHLFPRFRRLVLCSYLLSEEWDLEGVLLVGQ